MTLDNPSTTCQNSYNVLLYILDQYMHLFRTRALVLRCNCQMNKNALSINFNFKQM